MGNRLAYFLMMQEIYNIMWKIFYVMKLLCGISLKIFSRNTSNKWIGSYYIFYWRERESDIESSLLTTIKKIQKFDWSFMKTRASTEYKSGNPKCHIWKINIPYIKLNNTFNFQFQKNNFQIKYVTSRFLTSREAHVCLVSKERANWIIIEGASCEKRKNKFKLVLKKRKSIKHLCIPNRWVSLEV